MSPTSVPPEAECNAGESWWVRVPSFQKTILLSSHRSIIACHISIISTFQDISWYYILIPVNKSKAVRLGTRLFSNDALPQWSLLYKCCLPVVGLLKSRHWKTLKRGCTTVLWQDMQSNVVREHPVILSAYAVSIGSAKATRTRQMKLPGMTSLTSFGICHAAVSPLDLIEQGLSPVGSGQALQGVDKHQLATQWKTTVLLCGNYHMSVYVYVYWCIIGHTSVLLKIQLFRRFAVQENTKNNRLDRP